uniref:Aa_trans domain-containing protein n=1 Tax=Elaeophora elaphi TaxID=1147741 RepID=A0A0R3RSS0_9BILA
MMDNIEGSGNSNDMMDWSDDEDLGGEGSGGQTEGSGDMEDDQEEAISPIVTDEDVRHTKLTGRFTTATYKGFIFSFICVLVTSLC